MNEPHPSKASPTPTSGGLLLGLGLLFAAGVLGWQLAALSHRVEGVETQNLAMRDQLLSQVEALRAEVTSIRLRSGSRRVANAAPVAAGAEASAPRPAATAVPAAAPSSAPSAATETEQVEISQFLERFLFPEEAQIAWLVHSGLPLAEVGRRTRHSKVYTRARLINIEKKLAAYDQTPPAVLKSLRSALAKSR